MIVKMETALYKMNFTETLSRTEQKNWDEVEVTV